MAKVLSFFWRIISILLFCLLVLWVVYYFMKPDLPPQEIRDLLNEFLPQIVTASENMLPNELFDFFEITPINNIQGSPDPVQSSTWSILNFEPQIQ